MKGVEWANFEFTRAKDLASNWSAHRITQPKPMNTIPDDSQKDDASISTCEIRFRKKRGQRPAKKNYAMANSTGLFWASTSHRVS